MTEPLFAIPFQPWGNPEKIKYLLDKLCEHRPWFSDFVWDADPQVRRATVSNRLAEIWIRGVMWEAYQGSTLVGILFIDSIVPQSEAQCHFVFFDHALKDRETFCLDVMGEVFRQFDLHILRVEIPTHVKPLLRFVRRLGFRYESEQREPSWPKFTGEWAKFKPYDEQRAAIGSRKHHAMRYLGEWVDSLMLSVTREEYDGLRSVHETAGNGTADRPDAGALQPAPESSPGSVGGTEPLRAVVSTVSTPAAGGR